MQNHPFSLKSERGTAILMAVMGMALMSMLGAAVIPLASTQESNRTNAMASEQASALAQAALEYAKYQINNGLNPAVVQYPLGTGSFTVAAVPSAGSVTTVGSVGNAQKTYTLTTSFAQNCVDLDVSQATIGQIKNGAPANLDTIFGIKVTNGGCLDFATASQWTLIWTPDVLEKSTHLDVIDGAVTTRVYNSVPGYASGTQIDATDYSIASNVTNLDLELKFSTDLTADKSYNLTMHFSDGSSVTKSFIPSILLAP